MAATVAASSLKEALELLAADIAACCGCGGCCPPNCPDCPLGYTVTGYTATMTVDWSEVAPPCTVCVALLPSTLDFVSDPPAGVTADLQHTSDVPTGDNCDIMGSQAFGFALPNTYTLVDGDTYCLADAFVTLYCVDGAPILDVLLSASQGCVPDGRPCPGSAEICEEDNFLEVIVPLTFSCVDGGVRVQGSAGPVTVDFTFYLECVE